MPTPSPTQPLSRARIVIPIYEDWLAVTRLLQELAEIGASDSRRFDVILVDDGSSSLPPATLSDVAGAGAGRIEILRLRRNVGHQRAIAIGLAYLEATADSAPVIVMDGDGEDRPADVIKLLHASEANGPAQIVFAERTRRSEGLLFTMLYHFYRAAHWLSTGERVRVGNFSLIPVVLLRRLVAVSDLWNHYAAAVFKSRLPYSSIPTDRGVRYAGQSQMNLTALAAHGLSAMAAFGDRISVRLLTITLMLVFSTTAVIGVTIASSLLSGRSLPEWLPIGIMLFAVVVFQALVVALTFVFVILGSRDSTKFLPLRDYRDYILEVEQVRSGQA